MLKKLGLFICFISICCTAFPYEPHTNDRLPLSSNELTQLVSGNTMIGLTCHSKSIYLLYFYPDGRLYFKKNASQKNTYLGRWWVKGNEIMSQWSTYHRKGINKLRYYHVDGNVYKPYNINHACGPAGTYGHPFMVFKGQLDLEAINQSHSSVSCSV